jgi:hypothetical protein
MEGDQSSGGAAECLALRLLELLHADDGIVALPVKTHRERVPSGGRGFSMPFVRALGRFYDAHDAIALEMGDICKQATLTANVCNLMASTGLSLVESCLLVAEREGLETSALFGPASTFFSYSWTGSPLADVLAAVQRGVSRLCGDDTAGEGTQRFVWLGASSESNHAARPTASLSSPSCR